MRKILLAINGIQPNQKVFSYAVQLCKQIKADLLVLQIVAGGDLKGRLDLFGKKAHRVMKILEDSMTAAAFAEAGDTTFCATENGGTPPDPPEPQAAFIAPLDNLIWNRILIGFTFDFDYTWEVYTPAAKRKYAHYVLPVLYGDRFVARFEPAFDKKTREFTIANWWWEEGVRPDDAMCAALARCLGEFARYLNAGQVRLGEKVAGEKSLEWVVNRGG